MLESTWGGPEVDFPLCRGDEAWPAHRLGGRGAFTFASWFPCAVVAVKRLPGREEAWPARRCCRRGAGPGERRRRLLALLQRPGPVGGLLNLWRL